jgi:nitroreductase
MSLSNNPASNFEEAVLTRRAVRSFKPDAVPPRASVEKMLDLARYAPNGSNIQPWTVYVVAGQTRDKLCQAILAADQADAPGYEEEYIYYPTDWFEPCLGRRRSLGKALYGLAGIAKGDVEAMKRQNALNYDFFGAPVGLFFSIDKRNQYGGWIDIGGFLQTAMLTARTLGLHTCPQQSFSKYHRIVREHVPIPEDHTLVCGMAVGYADEEAVVNKLMPEKVPVEGFTTFLWE